MPTAVLLSLIPLASSALPSAVELQPAAREARADSAEQLAICREGILDPESRPEGRRRWVLNLFTFTSSEAHALIVELLGMDSRPEVQCAVCEVMAEKAPEHPERLNPDYVDGLLRLLVSQTEEVRVASAKALAEFPNPEVAGLLGSVAGDRSAPLPTRMAAIDALAPSTHRREVVAQLISLMDLEIPAITEKVAAALDPITPASFGNDARRWRDWWEEQKRLSDEEWLASQVRVYRERSRRVGGELAAVRAEREQETAALTARVREFQRDLLRGLPAEQREAKLIEWLDDPLATVKLASLAIVKSRIADEGKRPEGDLLAAVLRQIRHPSPSLRKEVLLIAQNLQAEQVVEAVLGQLKQETETTVRLAIFDTLGKLGSQAAVPALLQVISSKEAEAACVRDAATALGQIGLKVGRTEGLAMAVAPLKERYRQTAPDEGSLRAAMLEAMAGVGDPSFAPEFWEAMVSEDAALLQPAIQGLTVIGDGARLPQVRSLTAHPDPRVRLAAVEAVCKLGGEEADADALLARVGSAIEANESVRQASWRGWKELCARRNLPERVRAADRLREFPDLQQEYLTELVAALVATGNHREQLAEVRARLSQLLMNAGKYAEAVPYLRDLFAAPPESVKAGEVGLKWLEAVLRSPGQQGLADVIAQVSQADDPEIRGQIVATVRKYVDSRAMAGDVDRARRLLADLRTVDPNLVGDGWSELLKQIDASLKAAQPAPSG